MTEVEKFIEKIKKQIQDYEKLYGTRESETSQRIELWESILKSKESSKELKAIASLAKSSDYTDLARLAGEISLLHTFAILAINVRILEISVDSIREQLIQSRILEKAKDIDDIKQLKQEIDNFTRLIGSALERQKTTEEKRKMDLNYIV